MSYPYAGEQYGPLSCCSSEHSSTPPDILPFVVSLNGLEGILTLAGGSGVDVSSLGGTITIDIDTSGFLPLPYTGPNFRIKADGQFQIKNVSTGLYHDIGADGADGSAYMTFNDTGEA